MKWILYRFLLKHHNHDWEILKTFFGGRHGNKVHHVKCNKCGSREYHTF